MIPTLDLATVRRSIRAVATPERAQVNRRYFKTGEGQYGEGDQFLGVDVPTLRRLAREFAELPLAELRRLLASPWHEERLLALLILVRQYQLGDSGKQDTLYRTYLANTRYINNWDLVDSSAADIVGAHLADGDRSLLSQLARSSSLWERRIAIIATLYYIRRDDFDDTLAIAGQLLDDRHDLIHKAVGWMLREVGKRDRPTLERFLERNGARMPRTMLCYAIEHFPERQRKRYLARS